ncbi:MAG: hypothetical protein FD126_2312, partial [Elusimicrobia bacterium]
MTLPLILLLAVLPARGEEPPLEAEAVEAPTEAQKIRLRDYWERIQREAGEGDIYKVPAERLFDPKVLDQFEPYERKMINGRARNLISKTVKDREFEHPLWTEYKTLMVSQDGSVGKMMRENPALRQLIWDTSRPGSDSQLKRLLDEFGAARAKQTGLTLADFLKGLDNERLTKLLTGDKVKEKEDPETPKKKEEGKPSRERKASASEQAGAAMGSETMASVGFDGRQAYGAFGDRHVYKDKAGNQFSFSISTRRMPDGTMEDVVHIVNKLAAGVTVSVGGLPVTISAKPSGADHAISLAGPGGPLVNAKGEPPMSLSQAYAYRAARVFSYGRVVDIGGREYYVSPETYTQGEGPKESPRSVGYGQFAYWPKDQLDGLFAAREGRDEVDPQTFDFNKLDLKGSKFGSVRDMRPDLIATVIRREGAQDVALPRASMGQDSKGQWWDAVLRDGKYVVEKGQPPSVGHTPDGTTPPGQVRSDGWPQLGDYTPDSPEASRLNALLSAPNVKIYEATGAAAFDKKFIIMFNKDPKNSAHPVFVGQDTTQFNQVLGLEVLGGKVLAARSNVGVSYTNLAASGFVNGRPDLRAAGAWKPEDGFANVTDPAALKHALGLSGYKEADVQTILTRLEEQAKAQGAASFTVSGPPAGSKLPVAAGFNQGGGASTVMTLWPNVGKPEPGTAGPAPAGSGFVLDTSGPANFQHDKFHNELSLGDKTLVFVKGDADKPEGAAVYRAKGGEVYIVFTIKGGDAPATRQHIRAEGFDKVVPGSLTTAAVTLPAAP